MRTSNKLIITAFIITIVAMIIRDEQLKAVYLTKSYLNPLKDFTTLDIKDFTTIDVEAAGVANVKIVQGPFKVMVRDGAKDFIHVTNDGGHLHINASFNTDNAFPDRYYGGYRVYISCPSLSELKFENHYLANNKPITLKKSEEDWGRCNTVTGLQADSLYLSMDNGCRVEIDSNTIRSLKVDMAKSDASNSTLTVSNGNKIKKASFNVQNNGFLNLYSPIPDLSYTLAGAATMTLTGNVANYSKK